MPFLKAASLLVVENALLSVHHEEMIHFGSHWPRPWTRESVQEHHLRICSQFWADHPVKFSPLVCVQNTEIQVWHSVSDEFELLASPAEQLKTSVDEMLPDQTQPAQVRPLATGEKFIPPWRHSLLHQSNLLAYSSNVSVHVILTRHLTCWLPHTES